MMAPWMCLGRAPRDHRHQGQGLGRILLVDVLMQCQRVGQIFRFYAAMGFKPCLAVRSGCTFGAN